MLALSILALVVSGFFVAYIIHRPTLPHGLYNERKKLNLSISAYFVTLFTVAIFFTPLIFYSLASASVAVEIVVTYSSAIFLVLNLALSYLASRSEMAQSFHYWRLGRSILGLVFVATLTLCISLFLMSYTMNKLTVGNTLLRGASIPTTPLPTVQASPTPPNSGNNVFDWMESHLATTTLIGALIAGVITASATLLAAFLSRPSKRDS